MITRSIHTTVCEVMVVNTKEKKLLNKTVTVSGTFKDDKSLIKAVTKIVTKEDIAFVSILSSKVETKVYGISEQKFLELAEVIER